MNIPTSSLDLFLRDDAYLAGYTVDGEAYTAIRYFVVAQGPDGTRCQLSDVHFNGCESGYDDETGEAYFIDTRSEAARKGQALINKILARGFINDLYWSEIEPAYGSDAYINGNCEAVEAFRERAEDGFGDNILARVC